MPDFTYYARTAGGQDVAGVIPAASRRDALGALAERALFPLRVEAVQQAAAGQRQRVSTQELSAALGQLSDLLASGVPLLRSLDVLAEQCGTPPLARVLSDVRNAVADGTALDAALARHEIVFGELTISMVRAGVEGAFLEDALQRTADFLEQQRELKSRVVGAMTYPLILAGAGLTVTVVLIVFFVPKFAELFARLEEQGGLPTATVWLLGISDLLRSYGLGLAAAAAAAVWWLRRAARSERGRLLADRWKLRLPLAGPIFLGYALSRFCRVLGTLLRNGVPLLKALQISSDAAGNRLLAQAVRDSAQNVSSGETLARPLAACGLFPRPVMAMISVAEESNNLEQVLLKVADGLDRQNGRRLDLMVRLVEPLMLLLMAAVILFVLLALLLPVFEMSATIG
jgi:general secretion pathway protein F/type IV pilus assembly protein PilC